MTTHKVDTLIQQFTETLPKGLAHLKEEMSHNLQQILKSYLSQLNLITREEFDIQVSLLKRMRQRLIALEKQGVETPEKSSDHGLISEK